MSDYKNLNLDRDAIDAHVAKFLECNNLVQDGDPTAVGKANRYKFGSAGSKFAMVDLYLNQDGTTTITYKIGSNQELGEHFAAYLKATINPAEFESVNLSIDGIRAEDFDSVIAIINDSGEFEIEITRDESVCKQITLKSIAHQDQLKLTSHRTTRKMQIQGKPLSCYRRVIFMLTDLLDLKALAQVLYKKDDNSAEIVRTEMAEDHLKRFFVNSYEKLPAQVKKLLISSCCVKLASPQLPDYCLLLYPDLRALEGVLKLLLGSYGMSVADAKHGFGDFFSVDTKSGQCTIKSAFRAQIGNTAMESAFNAGYSFYRKHRHTLFHMEEFDGGSRLISNLEMAISLSNDAYNAIDNLYTART
ncbi:type II toxin-antitoxin system RnlA family toxin [Marinomonas shanghaiensis]|uniref:type II toxin-antitoxin system RnlA family toxin n=1 Tax=Marinomonas shanghaiensis TaxID=2202418 RepID=UPI003A95D77A